MENSNTLPKIEVGDTVIFRTDLEPNKPYGRLSFKIGMSHILGTEKRVTKISDAKNFACGDEWWYSPEMVAQVIKPAKERVYTEQEMFDFANSYADNVMGGMIKTPKEYFTEYIESLNK